MNALQITVPSTLREWLAKSSFDARTRERCWKKLARQLRHTHLSLEHCFRILQERAKKEKNPTHLIYGRIVQSLLNGDTIGKALSRYATPEEVMLIDSGQTGGEATLSEGFEKAADLLEKTRKIKGMILKEVAYPILLFCGVIGFLFTVSNLLVPQMALLSDPQKWTGSAWLLYKLSSFITSWYGAAAALLLMGGILLVWFSFKHWTGMGRSFADKIPPWSVYRILAGVSWLYATAILLQTRVKLVVILQRAIESPDTSPYLRSCLRPVYRFTMQGLSLGDALCSTPARWPAPILADDLRTYAALPGFNEQLGKIAEEMMEESMERIQRGASLLGVFSILLIILTIIFLVLGVFSIQQHVTQGIGL